MSKETFKQDFMASIVVFLVALPLCMGIAIASGVPVAAGLITGIVGGIVVGSIAGCPLQVSGPAAGLTVIILEIVQEYGLEALGLCVLAAGLLQAVAGIFKLGQWFRAVSPAVIKGMLAGIGVLIFASQFHVMVDDKPPGNGLTNLLTIPNAVAKALEWPALASQESREFRKKMLLQVGELHRQQQELDERIAEYFPHKHDPEVEFAEECCESAAEMTDRWIALQQRMGEQLTAVSGELGELDGRFPDEEQAAEAETAVAEALKRSDAALLALEAGEPRMIVETQDAAVAALAGLTASLKNHHLAAWVGVLSILAIVFWHWAPGKLRVLPGPLVAVCVGTAIAAVFSLPVIYVEIPDNLWDGVFLPSLSVFNELGVVPLIQSGLLIAIVASAETLLCATAVDQLHGGKRTNYDRELFAQGVGNTICGVLGVLPMTGVIVRSSANVHAGGQTRASAILHGIWLLVFVAAFGFLLRQIPTACLAAILVYTGFKLVNIKEVKKLAVYGRSEVFIYLATVITIVATDLLTGVVVGIALAAVKLLYTFSHLETDLRTDQPQQGMCTLDLMGAATFIRLPVLAGELERVPPGCELHVDFQHLDYIDHACLELLMTWAKQHERTGGRLVLDWESLHARFQPVAQRRNGAGQPPTAEQPVATP